MYEKIIKGDLEADVKIIDMRTDTISKPTPEMREAMYAAEVGDDVYGEDPTVTELERRSAELLGKEDALFVASGTMANLLASGAATDHAGIQTRCLKTKDEGTFDLDELREKIKKNVDIHETITSLIVVENTHNLCGGRDDVKNKKTLIATRARRIRKVLGGGWRQAGILAAAGLVALDTMIDRLKIDHDHAFKIARAVHHMRSNLFKVQLTKVQTNIILVYIDRTKIDIKELQRRLQNVVAGDEVRASVRCSSLKNDCVRFVTYHEITDEDIALAIEKIRLVIREYDVKYQLD
ncbi:unnamed protein product [Diabrotica balteata]|uniref:Aromatic amino acid beta-eliminating lyase/threonine aldolase domain-containing protein n=1 Tax=Diabrotica balteata TaxID=107213 RepID=A0A9N9T025_DIABA|nr:unnamed protein product [Diabrotica balteata]